MATRPRETPPGKEKRGISPTSAPKQRKSPNASPGRLGSTDHKHDSASSEKPIPNYLRPTISSTGYDHSTHHLKKHGSTSHTAPKSSLTRKRSFDKPPPPQASKDRNILRSSSSFASKSVPHATQKAPPNRLAKVPQDSGKKQGLYTKVVTVKRSSNGNKKQDTGSSFEKIKAYVAESSSVVDKSDTTDIQELQEDDPHTVATDEKADIQESQEDDPQTVVTDEKVMANTESNNEMPEEIVLVTDEEHIDPQQVAPTIEEKVTRSAHVHEDTEIKESSEGLSNLDASGSSTMEEANDHKTIAEEFSINNSESEQHVPSNDSVASTNDSHVGEPKEENQDKLSREAATGEALGEKEEATNEGLISNSVNQKGEAANEGLIANSINEKEEAANESQVVEWKETQEVENGAKEEKKEEDETVQVSQANHQQETNNVATSRVAPMQSKKESTVSNDVIEETASKLREQRRNKVKALAGAFESVMSSKEPKS